MRQVLLVEYNLEIVFLLASSLSEVELLIKELLTPAAFQQLVYFGLCLSG
jgi:hypothetical protein